MPEANTIEEARALYASPEARLKGIVVLTEENERLRTALRNIQHATAPTHEDGAYHEAAHDLATEALESGAKAPRTQGGMAP